MPSPVIDLSLNSAATDSAAMVQSALFTQLKNIAKREKLESNGETPAEFSESLSESLHDKYGRKVAVLTGEYDAPVCTH
jgi:hypothetical protein